jgi:hypothetical protein
LKVTQGGTRERRLLDAEAEPIARPDCGGSARQRSRAPAGNACQSIVEYSSPTVRLVLLAALAAKNSVVHAFRHDIDFGRPYSVRITSGQPAARDDDLVQRQPIGRASSGRAARMLWTSWCWIR